MRAKSGKSFWLGVDLGQEILEVSLAAVGTPLERWRTLPLGRFDNTLSGLQEMIVWVGRQLPKGGRLAGICVESTGRLSFRFAEALASLEPLSPAVSIINPKRSLDFARSLGVGDKSDRIDAAILALFGVTYQPSVTMALPESYRRLRELGRLRERLQTELFGLENTLRDSDDAFVCQSLSRCIAPLRKEIERIEAEARRIVREDPQLARDVRLLDSIKGIGFLTAWILLAELGDLRHYSRTQIVARVGLYPRLYASGKSVWRKPRLVKGGGALVRKALYNAARSIFRSKDNTLKTYLDRLGDRNKSAMDCLAALMRKLLLIARSVLIQEKPYDPHYRQNP